MRNRAVFFAMIATMCFASLTRAQENGLEAFYNLAITPATHLTFDVQVLDSVFADVDTTVIAGMRLNLAF